MRDSRFPWTLAAHCSMPRRTLRGYGIPILASVFVLALLVCGAFIGRGPYASAEDPTPTPGPFTPTFSWTFDDAAPDDPNVVPASDYCAVGAPCKSLWKVEIPEGQPGAPLDGMFAPSPTLQGAGVAPVCTILGRVFGSWKQGPAETCATSPTYNWSAVMYAASTDPDTTTGDPSDIYSCAHWPTQLNGVKQDFIIDHPGYELADRVQTGTFNTLYFTKKDNPTLYIAIRRDPTSPPSDVLCTPYVVNALGLGISADGIPLRTCQVPGENTVSVSLDRDDTPPGDPVILSDTANCSPNTPAGEDVSVPLNGGTENLAGIDVTFSQVTTEGSTTIATTTSGPPPPTGFEIVGLEEYPLYFDINTTGVEYYGDVTICIRYDETQVTGPEANLKLMHYFDDAFHDVTTSVDTENDIICGTATQLSPFIVAELAPAANPTPTVIATVSVGSNPFGVAVNPVTNRVYVSNANDNTVSEINGATNSEILPRIPVGTSPFGAAVNLVTNRIYVCNYLDGTLSVIDGDTRVEITRIPVDSNPLQVAVNTVTNRAYVTHPFQNKIAVINTETNTEIDTDGDPINGMTRIPMGEDPYGVAVNETNNRFYVADPNRDDVAVFNGATYALVTRVAVGDSPPQVDVDPSTSRWYATNMNDNNVSDIDDATNTEIPPRIPVGQQPNGVAVNRYLNHIYVANQGSNTLSVIDGRNKTVVATVNVGRSPALVAVNATTNRIYVTNRDDSTVSVIQDYPLSVGGIAEYPQLDPGAPNNAHGSSVPGTFALAGLATGVAFLLATVGWYARRQWLRRRA